MQNLEKLPIDTRVWINPQSRFYGQNEKGGGIITKNQTGMKDWEYYVRWKNQGYYYNREDLLTTSTVSENYEIY